MPILEPSQKPNIMPKKVATGELPFLLTSCLPFLVHACEKIFSDYDRQYFSGADTDGCDCEKYQTGTSGCQSCIYRCVAKKLEASRRSVRSDVDFVITFEELVGMFDAKGIDMGEKENAHSMHDATLPDVVMP